MSDPAFFGYGSLVNLGTHDYADPQPAALSGWRRVWRHTPAREYAFLSVEPHAETTLKGIVARVPGADWAALDQREAAYERQDVTHQIAPPAKTTVAVYCVPTPLATPTKPILLSYLDVVIQGYLSIFGPAGADHFFATTAAWDGGVLDDRADPIYPRHQVLTLAETKIVDAGLESVL